MCLSSHVNSINIFCFTTIYIFNTLIGVFITFIAALISIHILAGIIIGNIFSYLTAIFSCICIVSIFLVFRLFILFLFINRQVSVHILFRIVSSNFTVHSQISIFCCVCIIHRFFIFCGVIRRIVCTSGLLLLFFQLNCQSHIIFHKHWVRKFSLV